MNKQKELYDVVQKFIKDNKISCAEAISQCDQVITNAYDFIYDCCEIVGYCEDSDD